MEDTDNPAEFTDQHIIVAIEWAESVDLSFKSSEERLDVLALLLKEGFRRNMIQRTKWIRGFKCFRSPLNVQCAKC